MPSKETRSLLYSSVAAVLLFAAGARGVYTTPQAAPGRFPADEASNVSPDTHLTLTFGTPPRVGTAGQIRVYDAATRAVIDTLDLGVEDQRTVIGGFAEGFHFYPILVRGMTATVALHHNVLGYGRDYEIQIDPGAIVADGFNGIPRWRFRTRATAPSLASRRLVVAADGTGDVATIQGAVDLIPALHDNRITVFIKPGRYEEIVYFRNRRDITFVGEDRERVVVGYANNERFNGPPPGVATNERPDTFPYRRAAFMADRSTGIQIRNLTIENFTPAGGGQAEALLLSGGRNLVSRATLLSHQDTVQFNDSVYVEDTLIAGDTDFLWGRGPAFFRNCTLRQQSSGPFMWVRSTSASHGFVFDGCRFETASQGAAGPYLARNTGAYPDSEVVLIACALGAINPVAWMLPAEAARMRYWEFASTSIATGAAADVGQRHAASRQLDAVRDALTIANYRNPAYVLDGWTPAVDSIER